MSVLQRLRARLTPVHFAQAGVVVELLAAMRALAEPFRLGNPADTVTRAFLGGGLLAVGFAIMSVVLYFFGRYRLSALVAAACVVALVVYKALAVPGGLSA